MKNTFFVPTVILRILDRARASINQQVKNAIEAQRDNFATGWPEQGIQPLDPLYIEDFEASINNIGTLNS